MAVLAVLATGSVLHVPAAQAAQQAPQTSESVSSEDEGRQALEQAKASGSQVEVEGERGERTTVFANPDGYSFTLEESAVPVRVTKPGGGWQEPDATLERRADGTIGPKAASAAMSFSRGGSTDPLAVIEEQGHTLELAWQGGALPAPVLDGNHAVYHDVLPDVDLKVTATVESFQHVLVVKTPKAAANPRLKELTFGLKTKGLQVREGAASTLNAVDAAGRTVFRSPSAVMWNSAGKTLSASAGTRKAAQKSTAQKSTAQRSEEPAQDARATDALRAEAQAAGAGTAPGAGDKVSVMPVRLGTGTVSVVPDGAMLAETDTAAYPLFIDPTVTWGEAERTLLNSHGTTSYGWDNDKDNNGRGMGLCGSTSNAYCGNGYVQRLYFEFAPDSLKGKRVLDATFAVTEPWAYQCEPRLVDLVRTDNISSSTTWASRPKELDWLVDVNVSAGRGNNCPEPAPDAPIEFNDSPSETNENLTPTVRDFAAGKFSRLTLELRAHEENDPTAWKRFRNDAVLRVAYVAYPAKPTNVGIVTGSAAACSTNDADPRIISDPTPTLTSTPQTAPGGEAGAKLRAWFRIETQAADKTWSGSGISSPTGTNSIGDNVKATTSWGKPLAEGPLHRYASLTQALYDDGTYSQSSGYTSWCYFKVDPTAPKRPSVELNGPYKECLVNDCPEAGAPGVTGFFTFRPAAGDTNKSYQYRTTGATAWSSINGGAPKAAVTPPSKGTYQLEVRGVDTLGRPGASAFVEFKVSSGEAAVARWSFDEESGAALDASEIGGSSPATLTGTVTRDGRGRRGLITRDANGPLAKPVTDKGLALSGTDGYASTVAPVVQTEASYTASAWVRLDDGARNYTALGQNGTWYSAFYLGYRSDSKTWELRTSPRDASDGDISNQIITAKRPAAIGAWTHLAAVYNQATKQIKLYVNGELQGTKAVASSWASTGGLQIGRVTWRQAYYDYWKGSLDEVAVWQRALTDAEIADEARTLLPGGFQAAELVADWNASGVSGTTVTDTTSGYDRALTLQGGGSVKDSAIEFDGVDDAATTAGPLVDDAGSFTVTSEVAVDSAKALQNGVGYVGQIVGQRTANGSSWGLWFKVTGTEVVSEDDEPEPQPGEGKTVPVGFWQFGRVNADGSFDGVQSTSKAVLDTSVRLVGIFDAQEKKVTLRVGTSADAEPGDYTAALGSGEFAVAKGMTGGVWKHFLPARISDLRVWAGAMNHEDQLDAQIGS
ncbi:LamG domain-containing protein [Streptomyces sp. NPDC090025]|uniref:LamG domain-containing protein n=1 Tax=Streptomyces sp. NPDC090025 TaxID=3365922 RepID=UPI0038387967